MKSMVQSGEITLIFQESSFNLCFSPAIVLPRVTRRSSFKEIGTAAPISVQVRRRVQSVRGTIAVGTSKNSMAILSRQPYEFHDQQDVRQCPSRMQLATESNVTTIIKYIRTDDM